MTTPAELAYEEVTIGDSWKPIYTLTSGGVPPDLSVTGVDVVLYLRPVDGGDQIERRLSGSGEAAFVTNGKDGKIQFVFKPGDTAVFGPGWYNIEVVYEKPADEIEVTHARSAVHFVRPAAGART